MCQLRFVTVTLAERGVAVPDAVAVTLTVPLTTIFPDQVRAVGVCVRLTVVPALSLNCHPETVTPVEGLTVQVMLLPRVTLVQLRLATVPLPLPWKLLLSGQNGSYAQ